MSCSSVKHRFDDAKKNGLKFSEAKELFADAEGSVAAHQMELAELKKQNASSQEITKLEQHIQEGQQMLQSIEQMTLR
ncbi:MAG: hypothetical protein KGZ96_12295 [Clostridia bacterium]|jgi:hypothetical protein|nr:hypothetical protein [Clostridia bacterium]